MQNEIPEPVTVTYEDFQSVDFMAPLVDVDTVNDYDLESAYIMAAKSAHESGKEIEFRVFRILASLCGLHFRAHEKASPFGPQLIMNGRRSVVVDDFVGEQNSVLARIVPMIAHPGLKARIADVVWGNSRKERQAAESAVEAYCESIEGLSEKKYKNQFDGMGEVSFEVVDIAMRALYIASVIHKKQIPDRLRNAVLGLYGRAQNARECAQFERVSRLVLEYGLLDTGTVAKDAQALAAEVSVEETTNPMAVKGVWEIAAQAYQRVGNADLSRECKLQSVNRTLEMQHKVTGSFAEAHWIRTAIEELRGVVNTREQRDKLQIQMRELQEKGKDEYGTFTVPIDLSEERTGTIAVFEGLTLPDALLQFAFLSSSISMEKLREQALETLKTSPLMAMMSLTHSDGEGKVVAQTPGASSNDEPDEEWFKRKYAETYSLHRHCIVGGFIEPARETLMGQYPFSERHFKTIVENSPFIPATHRETFALGFARFFQGDFISAAHLLLPQVENSIRYVLKSQNFDSSKMKSDMLQEDRSLEPLLELFRENLENIFTKPLVTEIELLFVYRAGPSLRHEFAHGKVGSGHCFSADSIYACWLVYRLCCLPLAPYWKKHIAPAIEEECF